jgi:hypothetical protein
MSGINNIKDEFTEGDALEIIASGVSTASNQIDGGQKTQIVDVGGEAVTVTDGKLDVNATFSTGDIEIGAVELKNGTDDTRATVTAANALKVDGSAVTQPVSAVNLDIRDINAATDDITIHGDVGVVDQLDLTNSNPAAVAIVDGNGDQITSFGGGTQYSDGDADADPTGTVAMGTDGANVFAVHTDTSGDLQVDVLSSALPSGASTSALQTTGNTSLSTIAGAVSGTEVQVDVLTMPTVTVSATDLDIRNLVAATDIVDLGGNALTSLQLIDNAVSGTGFNISQVNGETIDVGAGTEAAAIRVTLPTNGTGVLAGVTTVGAVTAITNALPAGTNNIGDVDVLSIAAGDNNIGNVDIVTMPNVVIASGTVTTVSTVTAVTSITNALPVGANVIGKVSIDQATPGTTNAVQLIPGTTGGLSKFHLVSAATTNATNVKASAGQVYGVTAFNLNASARYLKFHNTAGTPTAGSGVTDTFMIPGNTAGAGLVLDMSSGITFSTGIGITLVTGIADADSAAVAASEVVLNVYYR